MFNSDAAAWRVSRPVEFGRVLGEGKEMEWRR